MILTITEFAAERHEDRDTVNAFIRKHPEIKKQVRRQGKNTVVDTDSEAYKLLDKQYPLPQLVQVIEDTESRQKLIKAQELIIQLQGQIAEASQRIAQAEAKELLLEDRTAQLAKVEARLEKSESQIQDLQEQLDRERSKSWLQKLLGK